MKEYIVQVNNPDNIALFDAQHTQDLVRCKDCKFYPDGKGTTKWLPCREIIVPPMWFCADGERKEGR